MESTKHVDEIALLSAKCLGSLLRVERRDHMLDALRSTGLSLAQIAAVEVVFVEDSISVTSLSKTLDLTLTTTSNLVQHLVEAGLLLRKERPDDRRERTLTLTPAGRRIVDKLMTVRAQAARGLAERMDEKLRGDLVNVLSRMLECLEHVEQG